MLCGWCLGSYGWEAARFQTDTDRLLTPRKGESRCHHSRNVTFHIQPIQEGSALGQLSARPCLPLPFLLFLGVPALQEGNFRIITGTNVITAGKKMLPGHKAITTTQLSLLMPLTTEYRKADRGVVTGLDSVGLMVLPNKPCNKTQWNQIPE